MSSATPAPSRPKSKWAWARLLFVGLILSALCWLSLRGDVRVCGQQATGDKDKAQTALELCRDLQPTDAAFVAAGLLALLLIGPEISEFSGFGFTLKKAREAQQGIEDAAKKAKAVETRLTAQIRSLQSEMPDVPARVAEQPD